MTEIQKMSANTWLVDGEERQIQETGTDSTTWLIFDPNMDGGPAGGVAVWLYEWGWRCEVDRRPPTSTGPECWHIRMAKEFSDA